MSDLRTLLLFLFGVIFQTWSFGQGYTNNMAVFITDFITNEPISAYSISVKENVGESLTLNVNYDSPGDFGSISFSSGSTYVFGATIVWDGTGEINPLIRKTDINLNKKSSIKCVLPNSFSTFDPGHHLGLFGPNNYWIEMLPPSLDSTQFQSLKNIKSVESAIERNWESIRQLQAVKDMTREEYTIGFYLYTPSVGPVNINNAKWITFIHYYGLTH